MAALAHVRSALLSPRTLLITVTVFALAAVFLVMPQVRNDTARRTAANPITPGVFTGLGFDQCQAPKQSSMDAWLKHSPFRSVGIYISGDSRACRYQTYLNATWVSTQLAKGWHLLPITLGPQASCLDRFPRYDDDFRISNSTANNYAKATAQGTAEGAKSVADAKALGIVPGSTIFYDLEGFTYTNTKCRESALRFVSAWNAKVKSLGYRAGFYSSAGSGIKMIDAARANKTAGITLPDQLWLARYDGKANTSATQYITDEGWQGNRIKQFQGGHNETWGGVTINIDRNYLDLRSAPVAEAPAAKKAPVPPADVHCGGVNVDLATYPIIKKPTGSYKPNGPAVKALTCLLSERTIYKGPITSTYSPTVQKFVRRWRKNHGYPVNAVWGIKQWMWLLAKGDRPTLKADSVHARVRDAQRALNASKNTTRIKITGVYDKQTRVAAKAWRVRAKLPARSTLTKVEWAALEAGRR